MRMHLLFLAIAILLGSLASAGHAENLRLVTGELPPYATRERPDDGIALNIVRQAFARSGYQVRYEFRPWQRALEEARAGLWDGTANWGKNPERDHGFLVSDNVITEQWVFIHRADRKFDWKTLADVAGLRIGAIRNYTYTPEFWAMQEQGKLQVDWAADDIINLRKLIAGRIDLVPLDRNVACYLLDTHFTPQQTRLLRAHPRLLTPNFTTHLMLSQNLPASAERMQAFNRGLRALRQSGEYRRLTSSPTCTAKLDAPGMPHE